MNFARGIHASVLLAASVWCAAIVVAPLLAAGTGLQQPVSDALYFFFGTICHQIDGRSFHLFGHQLAVCSRCFGIYGGFMAGTALFALFRSAPFIMPPSSVVLTAAFPMVIDVAAAAIGLYEPTNSIRLATGIWFGTIISSCLIPLVEDGTIHLVKRLNTPLHALLPKDPSGG